MNTQIRNKGEILKRQLEYEILSGMFRAGEKITGERELSLKYNVSRNTVRQAIDALALKGILERKPHYGTFLAANALDLLTREESAPALRLNFVFSPDQIGNSLWMLFLQTCCANLDPQVKATMFPYGGDWNAFDTNSDCDVLVVYGYDDIESLKQLQRDYKSLVLFNVISPDFNYIAPDNFRGGQIMAEFILGTHHRRSGLLTVGAYGTNKSQDFFQREAGIKEVFSRAGAELQIAGIIGASDFYRIDPYCFQAFDGLIRRHPDLDSMLCSCDMIALSSLRACARFGIEVPQRMSLMGFDDQFFASHLSPALSTIRYPAAAMGMRLAAYVNDLLAGKNSPLQEVVEPMLVKRDSVATR